MQELSCKKIENKVREDYNRKYLQLDQIKSSRIILRTRNNHLGPKN